MQNANQINIEVLEQILYLRKTSEPSVWTERMLTTLVKGVKRGKWYSLMDKVLSVRNIEVSTDAVLKNGGCCGIDGITVERYSANRTHFTEVLLSELQNNDYKPKAIKRVFIPKAGSKEKRPLGIPVLKDRVVQKALLNVLEPIFENEFSENSYGFRPKRCCKDALREVDRLLKQGYTTVIDADIKGYFDNISHEIMLELIKEKISDNRVLKLVKQFLKQDIMYEMKEWTPESGAPQGGIISPLLSNIYLDELDKVMKNNDIRMIRYADDFVILCKSESEACEALEIVKCWMKERKLSLNESKSRIVNMNSVREYFDFLGYRFQNSKNRIIRIASPKSVRKFRDSIRPYVRKCNGHSIKYIIDKIKPIQKGWFEYYMHCRKYGLISLDGWVRMRLRTILRKRQNRKGRARGTDNVKWPNKYFEDMGFFSLENALLSKCQSLWRNC